MHHDVTVRLAIHNFAGSIISVFRRNYADSVHFVALVSADKAVTVGIEIAVVHRQVFARKAAFLPPSVFYPAFRITQMSVAVLFAVLPHSNITRSAAPREESVTVELAVLEFPLIAVAVPVLGRVRASAGNIEKIRLENENALSAAFAFYKLSEILVSVMVYPNARSVKFAVLKLPVITFPACVKVLSEAFAFVLV